MRRGQRRSFWERNVENLIQSVETGPEEDEIIIWSDMKQLVGTKKKRFSMKDNVFIKRFESFDSWIRWGVESSSTFFSEWNTLPDVLFLAQFFFLCGGTNHRKYIQLYFSLVSPSGEQSVSERNLRDVQEHWFREGTWLCFCVWLFFVCSTSRVS